MPLTLTDSQVATIQGAIATIQSTLGPVGSDPKALDAAAAQYVADHFAISEANLDQSPAFKSGLWSSAAIVQRSSNVMTQSQGAPVYDGVLLGQAYFDAEDPAMLNPFAFKGTSNITELNKALLAKGPSEVWVWNTDGSVVRAKDGKAVGGDAGAEFVFVTGQQGTQRVPA